MSLTGLTNDEDTEDVDVNVDDDRDVGVGVVARTCLEKQYTSNEARKPNTVEARWHGKWGLLYNLRWAMKLPLLLWKTLMIYEEANESEKERKRMRMRTKKKKRRWHWSKR